MAVAAGRAIWAERGVFTLCPSLCPPKAINPEESADELERPTH